MSSCDFFTYNMAVMELIGIFGGFINIVIKHANLHLLIDVAHGIMVFPWNGQVFLPVLTCADRYMAVVHPITYLKLKQVTRIRIRNIITGYIWLQGIGAIVFMIMMKPYPQYGLIPGFSLLIFAIIAVISCSLPVLCVLIRPRPEQENYQAVSTTLCPDED
ncbi:hypothetical protein D5F01_LYC23075 [Larimichthys crocea]|uniref:G-protein coupled receptors family 1 profile domain-containing protein n=1 Tax=Larimichthys crocea TaxID=215358 RepID=A0A6G0HKI7_LARCR|nr:hypothetical protein D5F01_LYC23075 [Larimichthys crocea]